MKQQAGSCVVGHSGWFYSSAVPGGTLFFPKLHPALERQGARRAGLFSVAPAGAG